MSRPTCFKIVIAGDRSVGKTSFVTRHLSGNFSGVVKPTLGLDINPLKFQTNYGDVVFDVWDVSDDNLFSSVCDNTKAIILFFDVTNTDSYANIDSWLHMANVDVPIVICGNKIDRKDRVVRNIDISFPNYYDVSVKTLHNISTPFLNIARRLTGHHDLVFTSTLSKF